MGQIQLLYQQSIFLVNGKSLMEHRCKTLSRTQLWIVVQIPLTLVHDTGANSLLSSYRVFPLIYFQLLSSRNRKFVNSQPSTTKIKTHSRKAVGFLFAKAFSV